MRVQLQNLKLIRAMLISRLSRRHNNVYGNCDCSKDLPLSLCASKCIGQLIKINPPPKKINKLKCVNIQQLQKRFSFALHFGSIACDQYTCKLQCYWINLLVYAEQSSQWPFSFFYIMRKRSTLRTGAYKAP